MTLTLLFFFSFLLSVCAKAGATEAWQNVLVREYLRLRVCIHVNEEGVIVPTNTCCWHSTPSYYRTGPRWEAGLLGQGVIVLPASRLICGSNCIHLKAQISKRPVTRWQEHSPGWHRWLRTLRSPETRVGLQSCADSYFPSSKMGAKSPSTSHSMLLGTEIKNTRLHYPPQISHSALSAVAVSQGDMFKATRSFGPEEENNHWNTGRPHPRPPLTEWHTGDMRWLEGVPVEGRFPTPDR